jgi:4-hydroxybenzoyl-CoA reductase subunit beta
LSVAEKIFFKPKTLKDALEIAVSNFTNFKYIAGGTDVLVNKFQGNIDIECLIDLSGIEELTQLKVKDNILRIPALTKLSELKGNSKIRDNFPALIKAANSVATPLIRNSATLAGNLLCENRCIYYNQSEWWRDAVGYCLKCNGDICIATGTGKACYSEFVSDTAPVLINMNAKIEVADIDGERVINLEDIYTGDGVYPVNLSKTAIIKSILLQTDYGYRTVFKKLRQRESVEYTSLTSAVTTDNLGNIAICLGGVDPKPVVVKGNLNDDREEMIKEAIKYSRSVDNDIISRKYRQEMIRIYLQQSFEELFN